MRHLPWAGLVLALALSGCGKTEIYDVFGPTDGGASDSDSDTDTDGDSDSDTDADTDSDTDSDSDADDCPLNSGWPCTCDLDPMASCDDGSDCLYLQDLEEHGGYCGPSCLGQDAPCPDHDFGAEALCALWGGGDTYWCILICESQAECPSDQECVDTGYDAWVCL